jgi:acetyltransferase-like isoleucine patch superfamily enzyme
MVGAGAKVGAGAVIAGVKVGAGAVVAAGEVVEDDVPDGAVWMGGRVTGQL